MRAGAGAADSRGHVGLIVRPEGANLDLLFISQ